MKIATEKDLKDFEALVRPIYVWLQVNGCPHDTIIIQHGHAKVVSDTVGIPLDVND